MLAHLNNKKRNYTEKKYYLFPSIFFYVLLQIDQNDIQASFVIIQSRQFGLINILRMQSTFLYS